MEMTELVGRTVSESDYAIKSRPAGDDLDGKANRSALDLAQLRKDVAAWHEKLGRVQAVMREEQRRTQASMQRLLAQLLEHPPVIADVAETLQQAAGNGVAREVLVGINAASGVLQAYLEQQERTLGAEVPNLKGRVRIMRAELARYQDIAESATRSLAQNPHLPYGDTQRLQLEVSAYTRRQRELAQLESQLVDPKTYEPRSEEGHLKHLVMAALIGGK